MASAIPLRPALTLLALLAALSGAHAAGLDCKAAASLTERAVCADAPLRALDTALAKSYAQALASTPPDRRTALRQQQRDWLRTRDACGADATCLTGQYRQRLVVFGRPDAGDMAALEELRAALEAARRSDPEFPLEQALKPLAIKDDAAGTTAFSNTAQEDADDGDAHFPRTRPKGVSAAEWSALLASHVEGGGENGRSDYTLMDLDGDGLRDLVVNTYVGGTGLFTAVRILRQEAGKFVVPGIGVVKIDGMDADQPDAAYLYAYGDRGGNAEGTWVRLHGRVYALFRDSQYGVDQVSLLRPWGSRGQVPQLALRYRYRLTVPPMQAAAAPGGPSDKQPMVRLDPALHHALNAALARVNPSTTGDGARSTPLCPVPANASDELRENSMSYGPVHYSIEAVADMPVQVGKQCYLGQLRDWFGSYALKTGLNADLCIRKPEESNEQAPEPDPERCYAVDGKRTAIAVEAGTGPFDH